MSNTLVRKYRIKLVSRVLLRLLPPRKISKSRKGTILLFHSNMQSLNMRHREGFDVYP